MASEENINESDVELNQETEVSYNTHTWWAIADPSGKIVEHGDCDTLLLINIPVAEGHTLLERHQDVTCYGWRYNFETEVFYLDEV